MRPEDFGELRSALHSPSRDSWRLVCLTVERGMARDAAAFADRVLPYVESHLHGWPSSLRVLPERWLQLLIKGQRAGGARIARIVRKTNDYLRSEDLHLLLHGDDPLPQVEELDLFGNRLGPEAAEAIATAPCAPTIRALNLGANPLGADGLRALLAGGRLEALRSLDLSYAALGQVELGDEELDRLLDLEELRLGQVVLDTGELAGMRQAGPQGRRELAQTLARAWAQPGSRGGGGGR